MEISARMKLVGPCGIDCGLCELFLCKNNPDLFNYLVGLGIPESKLPCNGCRNVNGDCPIMKETCSTFECVVEKKVTFCYQCFDFPCSKLQPAADKAGKLPHNMKVFNLCTIQKVKLKNFVEISAFIRKRYFEGTMVIGNGPQIENKE